MSRSHTRKHRAPLHEVRRSFGNTKAQALQNGEHFRDHGFKMDEIGKTRDDGWYAKWIRRPKLDS